MKIEGETLRGALKSVAAKSPWISDWRKLSNGRIVRFVDWRGAARRRAK